LDRPVAQNLRKMTLKSLEGSTDQRHVAQNLRKMVLKSLEGNTDQTNLDESGSIRNCLFKKNFL